METGIDPKVDYAFKRVFAGVESADILPNLLNAVLMWPSDKRVTSVEILNPFSQKETLEDKQIILDIKARDKRGDVFLIEMQMVAKRYFPERLLYYLAKNYSQQLVEAEEWKLLRPIIVICFIDDVLWPQTSDYHARYEMLDQHTGIRFSDHWTIHVFELPKFRKAIHELSSDLDRWCFFLQHGNELDPEMLPSALETPAVRLATKVLQNMSHDTLERLQYEARQRFLRDQASDLAIAKEEGREEEARKLVIRIGTSRLRSPSAEIVERLNSITSLEQIESLADRILDCPDWDSLLEGTSE